MTWKDEIKTIEMNWRNILKFDSYDDYERYREDTFEFDNVADAAEAQLFDEEFLQENPIYAHLDIDKLNYGSLTVDSTNEEIEKFLEQELMKDTDSMPIDMKFRSGQIGLPQGYGNSEKLPPQERGEIENRIKEITWKEYVGAGKKIDDQDVDWAANLIRFNILSSNRFISILTIAHLLSIWINTY